MPIELTAWPTRRTHRSAWINTLPSDVWRPSAHGYGLIAGTDYPEAMKLSALLTAMRRAAKQRQVRIAMTRLYAPDGAEIGIAVRVVPPQSAHRTALVRQMRRALSNDAALPR